MKLSLLFYLLSNSFFIQNEFQFALPEKFGQLIIDKSNEEDVKKILGLPDDRHEIKKDQCTEIVTPLTMFYQYESLHTDLMFKRKNKKSKYMLQQIGFSTGTPFEFGAGIIIGKSNGEELITKSGKPENYKEGETLCYYSKGSGNYFTFLCDKNNIIVRVLVCKSKMCL